MVDIHCHILPEIDDGAKSWEMALDMCRMAADDGIHHIVATAHVNERYYPPPDVLAATLQEMRNRSGDRMRFSVGCEVHFSYDNLKDVLAQPARYAISDSPYLLVEFSDFGIAPTVTHNLEQLLAVGLKPIITHPERNTILARTPELVLECVECGCAVQVTASSLGGFWGERPRKFAEWLLRRNAVHVLATDAHDPRYRPPVLAAARDAAAQICGDDVARVLVEDNPQAIVDGRELPYFPTPIV
jgi:protein-tyrosine phosphatase